MISPALRIRLEFAAKSFLVASFVGVLTAGVFRLEQKALADGAEHVDLGAWSVVEAPAWATDDDVRALRDATRLRGWRASLLDPGAGPIVWQTLETAPQIQRYDALLELRRPVAAVQLGGRTPSWVEVDREGRPFGPAVAVRPVREGRLLRVIVGAAGGLPARGQAFGADVVEAADLSEELDRYGNQSDRAFLDAMDEIDVSNFGGRAARTSSEIVLRRTGFVPGAAATTTPPAKRPPACAVEWGRARPADAYDPEPLFGSKAARLVQVLRMFPNLDGLATVRLAFDDLVVVPRTSSPLARK
jgi:hypothetical protein